MPELRRLLRVGPDGARSDNLLVHGDAAEAMRALLAEKALRRRYAGEVALCYLDPPFNTGEVYGQYDDSMDRDAWTAMLRGALETAVPFLRSDGSLWLHLDDATQHVGRCLLDDVLGAEAFVATVVWQKRTTRDNRKAFSSMHDYIHVYSPSGPRIWKKRRNPLPDDGAFANPDGDPRGPWRSIPMTAQAGHGTAAQFYTVVTPQGSRHRPPPGRCWTYTRGRLAQLDAEGRVYWPKDGHGKPRLKRYREEVEGLAPFTIWPSSEVGDNGTAKKELIALHRGAVRFDTPKPERLLERVIHIGSNPTELVMDFFLGSGTTAAVASKMGRHWLGIERSRRTLDACTIPRLRAVLDGEDGNRIEGLGGTEAGGFEVLTTSRSGKPL